MTLRTFEVYLGVTGAGKSTYLAKNVIGTYRQNVIVIKHIVNENDPAFSFLPTMTPDTYTKAHKGEPLQCKMLVTGAKDYQEILKWAKDNYRNGALVIDDASYLEKDRMSDLLVEFVSLRRFYGLDIYMLYHGLTKFPIDQFIFTDKMVFFNTTDNIAYKKNKIPNYEIIEMCRKMASQQAAQYKPVILNLRDLNGTAS